MAKNSPDKKNIAAPEDEFLKIMEGGDDLSSFFEGPREKKAKADAPGSKGRPAKKETGQSEALKQPVPATPDLLDECGLELVVSADCMIAHLIGRKAHSFTAESLEKIIKDRGIIENINLDSLRMISSILDREGSWTGKIMVARGVLPPLRKEISSPFIARNDLDNDPDGGWIIDGKKLSFRPLYDLFSRSRIPSEEEISRVIVRPVNPGEQLAAAEEEPNPKSCRDIYGRSISFENKTLIPGKEVRRNPATGNYESIIFGYLCIIDNVLSVIPPIMISEDHMSAYFINCPQRGLPKNPSPASIKNNLLNMGVAEKTISASLIDMLCTGLEKGKVKKPLIKLAAGIKPLDGEDAKIELHVDLEVKAGAVLENDSIDLRERNLIHSVSGGEILATKYFPLPGKPGLSVLSKKIEQRCGADLKIISVGPIEQKRYEDRVEYYAEIDGNISFVNNILSLTDVYRINGDVDYATGNINVKTGLCITGSVLPGFKVNAGGDTVIGGTVENGAHVLVQGNLKVDKGIIGKDTKVIVMGSFQVEFVQDAEIMVKGDVEIKSYSFNSSIRSAGRITVRKSASHGGGKVVGGMICAAKGISLYTLGGPANTDTLAAIQRDVESLGELKKIRQEMQECTTTIMKIMKSLKMETVDMNFIRNLLEKLPADKKGMLIKVVDNLNKLVKKRAEISAQEKAVEEKIEALLHKAKVEVLTNAFIGSRVLIGDRQLSLDKDLGPAVFALRDGVIEY